jgi:CRP-like cAMP-binding protein
MSAGSTLIDEGSACCALYMLVDGWAFRYATTTDGSRQILAVLLPGDFCNLDSLSLSRPDYGIRTITPAKFLALERSRAIELSNSSSEVAQLFLSRMAIENALLGRWTLCLGRKSATARLAHLLCELVARLDGARDGDAAQIHLPLRQEQIADILGLTTVHVNRTIRHLCSLGVIERHGPRTDIPSVTRLFGVAEFDEGYLHRSERIGSRPLGRNSDAGSPFRGGELFS